MEDFSLRCCKDCRFWFRSLDPHNIRQQQGLCRRAPPSVTMLPEANGGLTAVSGYPQLPSNFPACGQFQAKLGVAVPGSEDLDQAAAGEQDAASPEDPS